MSHAYEYEPTDAEEQGKKQAVTSFVLSLVPLTYFGIYFLLSQLGAFGSLGDNSDLPRIGFFLGLGGGVVSIALLVTALVLGVVALKKAVERRGFARAGITISIIGLLAPLTPLLFFFYVFVMAVFTLGD